MGTHRTTFFHRNTQPLDEDSVVALAGDSMKRLIPLFLMSVAACEAHPPTPPVQTSILIEPAEVETTVGQFINFRVTRGPTNLPITLTVSDSKKLLITDSLTVRAAMPGTAEV